MTKFEGKNDEIYCEVNKLHIILRQHIYNYYRH